MMDADGGSHSTLRIVLMAGIVSAGFASAAYAGECPSGKTGVDVMKPGPMEPKGVTDTVVSSINLGEQLPGADGRQFRLRRLVVQPAGVVPWHEHADRPAQIYIVSGTITEYRSSCAVPIVHKAGEAIPESGRVSHWWENTGKTPAVLVSADLFRQGMKDDMM